MRAVTKARLRRDGEIWRGSGSWRQRNRRARRCRRPRRPMRPPICPSGPGGGDDQSRPDRAAYQRFEGFADELEAASKADASCVGCAPSPGPARSPLPPSRPSCPISTHSTAGAGVVLQGPRGAGVPRDSGLPGPGLGRAEEGGRERAAGLDLTVRRSCDGRQSGRAVAGAFPPEGSRGPALLRGPHALTRRPPDNLSLRPARGRGFLVPAAGSAGSIPVSNEAG